MYTRLNTNFLLSMFSGQKMEYARTFVYTVLVRPVKPICYNHESTVDKELDIEY